MDQRLVAAAKTGDVGYLVQLIEEEPLLLDGVSLFGSETPLHIASMRGHLPFVQEMLKLRKEFAYDLNQAGFTPLHLASANDHLQIVTELLKLDSAKLCTVQGWDNMIPLHSAAVKGRTHVMKELLSANPLDSIEMKTARGETVLHLAVKYNQFHAFKSLVEHITKFNKWHLLNEKDNHSNTILHYAALRKQYQVINLLLVEEHVAKSEVEVNSSNEKGMTALDVAALVESEGGDLEIYQILIEAGGKRGKDLMSETPPHNTPTPQVEQVTNNNSNNNNNNSPSAAISDLAMAIVVLIATATYQAVLSPPRGLWQEDAPDKNPPHIYGKSVLATTERWQFYCFIVGNTIGFYCCIYTISSQQEGANGLRLIRWAIYALSFTYSFSCSSIVPDTTAHYWLFTFLLVAAIVLPLVVQYFSRDRDRNTQHLHP